jgi:hypothetical protein
MDIGSLGAIQPLTGIESGPAAAEVAAVARVENPARARRDYSAAPKRVSARQDEASSETPEESAEDPREDRPGRNINLFA